MPAESTGTEGAAGRRGSVVLLTGPMRAGKTTAARMLASIATGQGLRPCLCPLALGVKQELARLTDVPVAGQERNRRQWRRVWQFWGTEVRRDICGWDYWLKQWRPLASAALDTGADLIIVPDVRFTREAAYIRLWAQDLGMEYWTLLVLRWRTFRPWRAEWWHRSEREWRRIPVNQVVHNNGSEERLRSNLARIWRQQTTKGT